MVSRFLRFGSLPQNSTSTPLPDVMCGTLHPNCVPRKANMSSTSPSVRDAVYEALRKHGVLGNADLSVIIRNATGRDVSKDGINKWIKTLLAEGRMQRIKYGTYATADPEPANMVGAKARAFILETLTPELREVPSTAKRGEFENFWSWPAYDARYLASMYARKRLRGVPVEVFEQSLRELCDLGWVAVFPYPDGGSKIFYAITSRGWDVAKMQS